MLVAALLAIVADSATLCVRDARTAAPVLDVQAVDSTGSVRVLVRACNAVPAGPLSLRRIGYRSLRIQVPRTDSTLVLLMVPVGSERTTLDTARIVAAVDVAGMRAEDGVARSVASIEVRDAQRMGIGTMGGFVAAMPYSSPRSARGETGLSLRGARREGVAITLDGLPLNDPATGVADIADLPLIMLGSATVALGSDPYGVGPGASGGVLALHSTARRAIAARAGSFGQRSLEGAWHTQLGAGLAHASVGLRQASNDFEFENSAGAVAGVRERRQNNDEQRAVAAFGYAGSRAQALVLASTGERGMVGAANVRAYDADRARTTRLLLRTQLAVGAVTLVGGARGIELGYRDPANPTSNSRSRAMAGDVEARGATRWIAWRLGVGGDRVHGTPSLEQSRGRGFAAVTHERRGRAGALQLGARADAVGTLGVLGSFSAAVQRRVAGSGSGSADAAFIDVGARVAQAVRVPTLYDLYFSSPQRLFVRALRPERVSLDAELNSTAGGRSPLGMIALHSALVARDTRDAIVWFPGNFGWSPANVGIERLRGAESRLSLTGNWGGLSGWGAFYDTELTTGALKLPTPYVARWAGGGQATANLRSNTLSALLRSTGRRPYTAGPRNPDYELPATMLLDLAVSHRRLLPSGIDALFALSLENVTAVAWQSVQGFPSPGRAWAVNITLGPSSTP